MISFARLAVLLVLLVSTPAESQLRNTRAAYATYDSAASAAAKAGNWVEYRSHVSAIDTLMNGHPLVLLALARAAAQLGDTGSAHRELEAFASTGLVRDLGTDSLLTPLRNLPWWADIKRRLDSNARRQGEWTTFATLDPSDFIAEDISYDTRARRFLVTSIRYPRIDAIDARGAVTQTRLPAGEKFWGMLAVAVDNKRSRIWATTYAVPQSTSYNPIDSGKASLLRIDLRTGALQRRYEFSTNGRVQEPGDIAVAENGDLFVSDGRRGIIYVVRGVTDSLSILVPPGELFSPQGPAVPAGARYFFVADYARGLARVDRATGAVLWLSHPRGVALNGIDGLTVVNPTRLIAIQNGVTPNRVVEISIDAGGTRVTAVRVLAQDTSIIREPTHGALAGGEFYFIGNGGFAAFDEKGLLKPGVVPVAPAVLRLRF